MKSILKLLLVSVILCGLSSPSLAEAKPSKLAQINQGACAVAIDPSGQLVRYVVGLQECRLLSQYRSYFRRGGVRHVLHRHQGQQVTSQVSAYNVAGLDGHVDQSDLSRLDGDGHAHRAQQRLGEIRQDDRYLVVVG